MSILSSKFRIHLVVLMQRFIDIRREKMHRRWFTRYDPTISKLRLRLNNSHVNHHISNSACMISSLLVRLCTLRCTSVIDFSRNFSKESEEISEEFSVKSLGPGFSSTSPLSKSRRRNMVPIAFKIGIIEIKCVIV